MYNSLIFKGWVMGVNQNKLKSVNKFLSQFQSYGSNLSGTLTGSSWQNLKAISILILLLNY